MVTAAAAIIILGYRDPVHPSPFNVFVWSGVIGTLILLVAYILATLGAMRMLWFRGRARVPLWQIVIPIAGAARAARDDLLQRRLRTPPRPTRWNYYTAGIWVLAGVVLVLVLPGLATRVGQGLSRHEGLADTSAGDSSYLTEGP